MRDAGATMRLSRSSGDPVSACHDADEGSEGCRSALPGPPYGCRRVGRGHGVGSLSSVPARRLCVGALPSDDHGRMIARRAGQNRATLKAGLIASPAFYRRQHDDARLPNERRRCSVGVEPHRLLPARPTAQAARRRRAPPDLMPACKSRGLCGRTARSPLCFRSIRTSDCLSPAPSGRAGSVAPA
jgi:hypothetical protein